MILSSAKNLSVLCCKYSGKSFIYYIRKIVGPRTVPWGTPSCGFRFCNSLFMPVSVMLMFCISRCGLCPLSAIGSLLSGVKDF